MGLASKRIFKTKQVRSGFNASDPARTKDQAFELARNFPDDMPAIVVKTGEKGDVYPYTIYVKEMFGDQQATSKYQKIFKK